MYAYFYLHLQGLNLVHMLCPPHVLDSGSHVTDNKLVIEFYHLGIL